MLSFIKNTLAAVLFFTFSFCSSAWAQTVYLSPADALKIIFPSSTYQKETKTLTEEQKIALEKQLGAKLSKTEWEFTIAKTGKKMDGITLIDNEIGKTEPITFMTALLPDGSIKDVEILVYREAYGSEVTGKGFLKQFNSKKQSDPLILGKDISNVTGATLSSRAITRGVKRAVALWKIFYGK